MRVLFVVALLALHSLVVSASPLLAQSDQPTGAIAVEDSASQDAAIAERLRAILGELGGFDDITVTVSSGIVTLRGTTLGEADVQRLDEIAGRVEGVVAIQNEATATSDVVRRLDPIRDRIAARVSQLWTLTPLLAIAGIVFAVVWSVGWLVARLPMWSRLAPNAFISDIYRMLIRLAFLVIGIVLALDILDATALLSTILGAAGLIGLAVGFAVRDTVENFIASVMLSIRQPFRPNDAVEINGDEGKVIRLTSRATILLSFDGNHIRIPNATVFKSRIVNYSTNPERRFMFDIGIAPDADLAQMRRLAEEVVSGLPFTLANPAPMVWTKDIGDGAVFLTVTGWINQNDTTLVLARGEALRKVKAAIEAAGVEVPDTTYRVQLLQGSESDDAVLPAPRPSAPTDGTANAVVEGLTSDDTVTSSAPGALDKMIEDERDDAENPDLLRPEAPHE
ncbi:mechanosensitive ion channel family protein [Shimia ponticola]|uniref:mechanosensitive ion channel family protein n=1 Tax=Shimia ponticola TaxID=2582893 RepID=UPI0011BE4207|nr:mechanosensitive ion channel family protein [Shimia ponticola]